MGREVRFVDNHPPATPQVGNYPGTILSNVSLTDKLWIIEVACPEVGKTILPGQFVHLLVPGMEGHILRRPFSVYYTKDEGTIIGILYQVVGFGSAHMTALEPEDMLEVLGPVGHGWNASDTVAHALLVAGGVGSAPLYLHAEELVSRGISVDVVLGAQNDKALVSLERYQALVGNNHVWVATDDGSLGHRGFCTDVVAKCIEQASYDYVACCGPEPMMRIVSQITLAQGIRSYVSLEKRMACGIGACLGCIVETKQGRKRSCVDGPVFDAAEVLW